MRVFNWASLELNPAEQKRLLSSALAGLVRRPAILPVNSASKAEWAVLQASNRSSVYCPKSEYTSAGET
jgi:hypothetical protein